MAIVQRGGVLTAADAAAGDQFGNAVALSSNGLVMAVGAPFRQSSDGGVYIYDWNGSAWVARGGAINTPNTASGEMFGAGVALSDDGTVLAVGAPYLYQASPLKNGGVHIYDWNGSAWVARGAPLTNSATAQAFGWAVALSGTGAVLAVGAPEDDFFGSNAGGAYLFDWNGSAWVARGGMLYSSDTTAGDQFGIGLALSSDGAILAAGGNLFDAGGVNLNDGAVWLFDWNGSAWVQRAAKVLAGDGEQDDFFGSGVALSADGAILAVGAPGLDAATPPPYAHGGVYLFDWDGSAWIRRDIVSVPAPTSQDKMGTSVALSSTGTVLVSGAVGRDDAAADAGGVYIYDVTTGDYVAAATSLTVEASTGTAIAATALTVTQKIIGYTTLTMASPTGAISAPTRLDVTSTGSASADTALALIDFGQHWPLWSARVVVDGSDISSWLVGQVRVEAVEGAARIAGFAIIPAAGTVAPLDYVGKPVYVDYLQTIGGATVARRLFTGRIDTPRFEPTSGRLDFACVDDLQNRVAALPRSLLDGLIGGRYTRAVQGDILDNWDYAQAQMSTVAGSLDAGPHGGLRVTPWEIASSWASYSDADLIYAPIPLQYPQRSTLVNSVDIEFDYRYPRLRQRYTSVGWSGTVLDMAPCGYQYPTQQDILGAAGGSGWQVTLGIFYPAPAAIPHSSGGFIYPADDAVDMAILFMAQRHSQTVTERYTLTVTAPESVTANGTLPFALRGALASEFDGNAWESALDVAPLMPTGGDMDYAPDALRADADHAIETLLAQANVKILGSHRSARVGSATLCNPDLDLDKRVTIATGTISAAGKVATVRHILDLDAGSATTEFEIACFGVGGAGIVTPDTLAAPTPPAEAAETQDWQAGVASLMVNTYGITPYSDSLMGLLLNPPESISVQDVPGIGTKSYPNAYYTAGTYPVQGFRVQMPGVDDADRNPIDKTASASYSILIPADTLTFTVT